MSGFGDRLVGATSFIDWNGDRRADKMQISLLDNSLFINIFYDLPDQAFEDNICIQFLEKCPEDEKIFRAEETNIYLTPEQAAQLAEALSKAAADSKLAQRKSSLHERRFDGAIERLRTPERIARLEVERTVALSMEGLEAHNLLDVGTGSGLFAEAFQKQGLAISGVDVNAQMVQVAGQLVPEGDFKVAPAEALPFPAGTFDLVFMGVVFHETDDALQALREARRVARQRVVILEWLYQEEEFGPPLAHRLKPEEVAALAYKAGFEKVETLYLDHMVLYRLCITCPEEN
jgi:ubiquinone/menaquinone biosynthesis C-methylase UbiE